MSSPSRTLPLRADGPGAPASSAAASRGGGAISHVSLLAAPRGVKLVDELTGRPAALRYEHPAGLVLYYSDVESLELDASVLDEIGPALAALARERGAGGTAEERAAHAANAARLLAGARAAALDLAARRLVAGDYARANPAALRALKLAAEGAPAGGAAGVELVPAYILLAESCLGLGRHAQADGFVSTAELALSSAADPPPASLARLLRLKGKVAAARGDLAAAVRAFAAAALHAAAAGAGPDAPAVAPAYFHLGATLAAAGDADAGMANYDKVVDVWYKALLGVESSMAAALAAAAAEAEAAAGGGRRAGGGTGEGAGGGAGAGAGADAPPPAGARGPAGLPVFAPAAAAEGIAQLLEVLHARERVLGPAHVAVAEARLTAGLLTASAGDIAGATTLIESAAEQLRVSSPGSATAEDAESFLAALKALRAA